MTHLSQVVGLFGASAFAAVAAAVVTLADFCFWYIDFGLIPCTDAPVVSCSARSFDVSHVRAVEKGLVDGEGRSDVE